MEIKFKNRTNKSYEVDGKTVWESRSPALVAVIMCNLNGEKYVLLGQRGEGAADYQGLWNVPCGYLDWDENGYEGICREVFEETGFYIPEYLNFSIISDWLTQPFNVNTEITENRQNVALSYGFYFSAKELPKLTTENSEHNEVAEAKWVKVSELNNYKFAFNHDIRIKHFEKKIGI